jgi:uncharacterized membrane protein (DUF2068 family)
LKLSQRPLGLILIVAYKGFSVLLLVSTAISLFLALGNYEYLIALAQDYTLTGKRRIVRWLVEKALNLKPRTLEFGGVVVIIYAAVTLVEAIGLWYAKSWARWLVLGLVGISIPPEIYELVQGRSALKLVIFLLNLAVFWYVLREFPQLETQSGSKDKQREG